MKEEKMKSKAIFVVMALLFSSVAVFAQEGGQSAGQSRGQGRGQGRGEGGGEGGQQRETVVDINKVTPEIPGVVKAGTKIEIVKNGLRGSDGGVGMPDGSLLITANGGLAKGDGNGDVTVLVGNSNEAAGLSLGFYGRVFSAHYFNKGSLIY